MLPNRKIYFFFKKAEGPTFINIIKMQSHQQNRDLVRKNSETLQKIKVYHYMIINHIKQQPIRLEREKINMFSSYSSPEILL